MNGIGRRIDALLRHSGFKNRNELADSLGVSRQYLSQAINGKSPAYDLWLPLCEKLGTTEAWLRHGKGDAPHGTDEPPETLPRLLGRFAFSGRVTAGGGFVSAESGQSTIELRNGLQAVYVEGDSAFPVVFPGQYVVVDPTRPPNDGNLVVCQTEDGQALLKRYLLDERCPGGFALVSVRIGQSIHTFNEDQMPQIWPVVGILFPKAFKREPI